MAKKIISGKINSYKRFIHSKKVYLKRKKLLNREIKKIKKRRNLCKHKFGKGYYNMILNRGKDDLYVLRIMYNFKKRENKLHSKHK